MIPQEKSAEVTRGLREAFGVTAFEDIHRLTRGHTSSLVFRIVVRGFPFLLKFIVTSVGLTARERNEELGALAKVSTPVASDFCGDRD